MKRISIFVVVIVIVSCTILIARQGYFTFNKQQQNQNLFIYNWGDYIDPTLIESFEEEYGYNVIYETFDSNESMYIKVKEGTSNYDVIFPSDYMVSKMISEDLLMPIDYDKIDNFTNIDSTVLNQQFDYNNKYSIPYFWGTVGIVYNTKMLDDMNVPYPLCYEDLESNDYENSILLADGAREVLTIGLAINGYSLNTTDADEVQIAIDELHLMDDNIKAIVGDEIKAMMVMNEAPIALGWSGDATYMMELNEDLEYVIPCEGGNVWIDSFAIPKTSHNTQGAYDFINFMLDEENARINAEYVGYESPIKNIVDENRGSNPYIYPSEEIISELEYYIYKDEDQIEMYNESFIKYKSSL